MDVEQIARARFSLDSAREFRDSGDLGRSLGHYMGSLKFSKTRDDYEDEFTDVLIAFCRKLEEDSTVGSGDGGEGSSSLGGSVGREGGSKSGGKLVMTSPNPKKSLPGAGGGSRNENESSSDSSSSDGGGGFVREAPAVRQIEEFYQIGVQLYPESARLWEVLGTFYHRIKQPLKARECFFTALAFDPTRLMAKFSLHSLIANFIPHWHYKMVNDAGRNSAYKTALTQAIASLAPNSKVLDIGTGTGILALFAAQANPARIVACEEAQEFAAIAEEVCTLNGCSDLTILATSSVKLSGKATGVEEKFNLVVSEILDSGCLGEGVVSTMIHAHENLMDKSGDFVVIPQVVTVHCAAISCQQIGRANFHAGDPVQKGARFSSKYGTGMGKQYDSVCLRTVKGGFSIVSPVYDLYTIDLADVDALRAITKDGTRKLEMEILPSPDDGGGSPPVVHGVMIYFTARLFGDVTICTHPDYETCWDQAVFPIPSGSTVKNGKEDDGRKEVLRVEFKYNKSLFMSCMDSDSATQNGHLGDRNGVVVDLVLAQQVLLCWNDVATKRVYADFVNRFREDSSLAGGSSTSPGGGSKKLLNLTDYVFSEDFVVNCCASPEIWEVCSSKFPNLIPRTELETASTSFNVSNRGRRSDHGNTSPRGSPATPLEFGAICFCPVDMNGLMKLNIVEKVQFDAMLFSVERIFPSTFRAWGQVIASPDLLALCQIEDTNCCGVKIDDVLRPYYTEVLPWIEPSTLAYRPVSGETLIWEFNLLRCDEGHKTLDIPLEILREGGPADAILVWFEWEGVVTKRANNAFYVCAYVLGSQQLSGGQKVDLHVLIQNGLFDFSIVSPEGGDC